MLRTNRNVPGTNGLAYFSLAKMWKKKSFVSLTPDFIPSDVFLFSFAKKKSWESFLFLPQKSNNFFFRFDAKQKVIFCVKNKHSQLQHFSTTGSAV
jgi:hypothetical protein